jgi:hypothetical protein
LRQHQGLKRGLVLSADLQNKKRELDKELEPSKSSYLSCFGMPFAYIKNREII